MYGAIDIGTNSVRLLIGHFSNEFIPIYRDIKITRLGEGVQETNLLKKEAIERTLDAVACFYNVLNKYNVDGYRIVATSAARDADNKELLLAGAEGRGIKVEIISGHEEGWLSYAGAVSSHKHLTNPVVIDIGGGSTEIIYLDNQNDLQKTSINVGAVRCTEGNWNDGQIIAALKPVLEELKNLQPLNLIGVGGTITTLAAIFQKLDIYDPKKVQGFILRAENIQKILCFLQKLTIKELQKVPGLNPQRADIIVAGTKIIANILQEIQAVSITVSESDLLEGIIMELQKSLT
ncbi:Ppx/GppA family phosphatase [Bacillota bacterium LX-D]|nr:Ppx/GppA family phosphatase [Bacillota bacterium LX-D]